MTREEVINVMRKYADTESGISKVVAEAHRTAIKALEQEPKTDILDKIRAEIEQNVYPIVHGVNNHELGMTLYGILQVIDKYKAESEGWYEIN